MATATLTATKADAQHRIVAMFCKHLTTLDEMCNKAREHQVQFATNPDAQVPMKPQVEATGFIEVYSPATVIEMTISSIEDTTRQLELEMARTETALTRTTPYQPQYSHPRTVIHRVYLSSISSLNLCRKSWTCPMSAHYISLCCPT